MSAGWTIQYSVTPDFSYRSSFCIWSLAAVEGERISTMKSGAPRQPRSSSLLGSHITTISGWTTLATSSSASSFLRKTDVERGVKHLAFLSRQKRRYPAWSAPPKSAGGVSKAPDSCRIKPPSISSQRSSPGQFQIVAVRCEQAFCSGDRHFSSPLRSRSLSNSMNTVYQVLGIFHTRFSVSTLVLAFLLQTCRTTETADAARRDYKASEASRSGDVKGEGRRSEHNPITGGPIPAHNSLLHQPRSITYN